MENELGPRSVLCYFTFETLLPLMRAYFGLQEFTEIGNWQNMSSKQCRHMCSASIDVEPKQTPTESKPQLSSLDEIENF